MSSKSEMLLLEGMSSEPQTPSEPWMPELEAACSKDSVQKTSCEPFEVLMEKLISILKPNYGDRTFFTAL